MVIVESNSKMVIVEPIKTKSNKEIQYAYLVLLAKVKRANIVPLTDLLLYWFSDASKYEHGPRPDACFPT